MSEVNVDEKLMVNKFNVDEEIPHIVLKELGEADMAEFHKLELACPAGLYRRNDAGQPTFDYAGCLECGTCRMICGETILEKWDFPRGTFGVEYRFG